MGAGGRRSRQAMAMTPELWDRVADQYRMGIDIAQIAEEFGLKRKAIYNRMSRANVRRGNRHLKNAIISRTHEMLADEQAGITGETNPLASDADRVVDAVAKQAKRIIADHRTDVALARTIYRRLLDGISDSFDDEEVARENGLVTTGDRASAMATVVSSMDKIINLERKAWNLDEDDQQQDGGIAEILARIQAAPQNSIRTVIQMKRVGTVRFEAEDAAHN